MDVPFVDLKWQHKLIEKSLRERLEAIFKDTAFVLGPDVALFEKNFGTYLGDVSVVGVGNGTEALILALRALDIGAGDEVITIPTTFIATASAIRLVGARPVFVDIDQDARNFNLELLGRAVTGKTKAIIPVHLYGDPVEMMPILELARAKNIAIVEDACQAHGARYQGKRVGTLGAAAAFSFYPGKNLGAYGEAGAVATSNPALAEKVRQLRNHGGIKKYEHAVLGYNSRLDSVQAAVLDEKLKFLDEWNNLRRGIARQYFAGLGNLSGLRVFPPRAEVESAHHLFVAQLDKADREDFLNHLKEKNIGAGIHYPEPLHLLAPFADLGYRRGDLPVAEAFAKSIVSLPIFPGMTEEQADYVIEVIKKYFNGAKN